MFFREKKSKNSKRLILQLVENIRTKEGSRQKSIVSLGSYLNIPKELRPHVARLVKERILGQHNLFTESPEVLELADKIIKKIQTEGKWHSCRQKLSGKSLPVGTAEVFVDDVQHSQDRILGPLLVGHTFWKRLNLSEILSDCGFNPTQVRVAELSILHRLISPGSELSIPEWIKTVAAEELIDSKAELYSKDRFYRISDKLLSKKEKIEDSLYQREQELFNLENTIYLYDLTNTYFEGLCQKNPKAEFNMNQKEKRSDCRQISVGLVLDSEGFARRHEIFKGSLSDTDALKHILKKIKKEYRDSNLPTLIFDRGAVSEENLERVRLAEFKYIVTTRVNEEKEFIEDFENLEFRTIPGRDGKKKKEVKVYKTKKDEDIYLLCRSEGRKQKESAIRNKREKRLEEELSRLLKSIKESRIIDRIKIERRIGRLKERYSQVAKYYEINYKPTIFDYSIPSGVEISKRLSNSLKNLKNKHKNNAISHKKIKEKLSNLVSKYAKDYQKLCIEFKAPDLKWAPLDEKEKESIFLEGNYLLRTNNNNLTDIQFWSLYMMLTKVESSFRDLKSSLGLRPNYHQLEKRVEGHIFISILAYHLLHSIEYALRQRGETISWLRAKRILLSHTYSTIHLPTVKGPVINTRKAGIAEGAHKRIYDDLRVYYINLPVKKTVASS